MFILFIIAGMLTAFGICLLISSIQRIRNGIIVDATVIDIYFVESTDNEESDKYFVTFKFHTLDNEEIAFTWDLGSANRLQIGDKISIVYQKYNPQDVVSLDYGGSFWTEAFLFSLALILIIIAAGYYWAQYFFESLVAGK
jgi:hypothetical protein